MSILFHHPELSLSSLSISSFREDWDKASPSAFQPQDLPPTSATSDSLTGPSTPPPSSRTFEEINAAVTATPGGTRGTRSLSDLLRMHAERGQAALRLTPDEEQRLEDELAKWVNSEEDDDVYFSGPRPTSLDGANLRPSSSLSHRSPSGRSRRQSEGGVADRHNSSASSADVPGTPSRERKDSSRMLIPGKGVRLSDDS